MITNDPPGHDVQFVGQRRYDPSGQGQPDGVFEVACTVGLKSQCPPSEEVDPSDQETQCKTAHPRRGENAARYASGLKSIATDEPSGNRYASSFQICCQPAMHTDMRADL